MYTTLTVESNVTQERKLEIYLPDDAPLGKVTIIMTFTPDVLDDDSEPDESAWELLKELHTIAFSGGPSDLADRHDDYLYGEIK